MLELETVNPLHVHLAGVKARMFTIPIVKPPAPRRGH